MINLDVFSGLYAYDDNGKFIETINPEYDQKFKYFYFSNLRRGSLYCFEKPYKLKVSNGEHVYMFHRSMNYAIPVIHKEEEKNCLQKALNIPLPDKVYIKEMCEFDVLKFEYARSNNLIFTNKSLVRYSFPEFMFMNQPFMFNKSHCYLIAHNNEQIFDVLYDVTIKHKIKRNPYSLFNK